MTQYLSHLRLLSNILNVFKFKISPSKTFFVRTHMKYLRGLSIKIKNKTKTASKTSAPQFVGLFGASLWGLAWFTGPVLGVAHFRVYKVQVWSRQYRRQYWRYVIFDLLLIANNSGSCLKTLPHVYSAS